MESITMTATEVCKVLRDAGVPCTPKKIIDGIQSGAYPFGRVFSSGGSRRRVEIYRVDFMRWLKSKQKQEE